MRPPMTPDAPASPPLLAARGLRFLRNEEPVFGPLDFEVHGGEALLVLGGNGAGKTTLLRVLAGLLALSEGEVLLDGETPTRDRLALAVAYLGHHLAHKGELTALENLAFAVGLGGQRPRSSLTQALASVGLAGYEDTPARKLSAGQKKRLSLARLLLVPARLWLLDEPYANLDLDGITLVNRMIRKHVGEGGAALITTHGAYAAPPVRTRTLSMNGEASRYG
jgi:heme exporter protein A